MSYKNVAFHGLTAGIKTLKCFRTPSQNLRSLQASNLMLDSGNQKGGLQCLMNIYRCIIQASHFNVLKIIVHQTRVFLSIFQTSLSKSNIFHQIRHVLKSDQTSDIRQNYVPPFSVRTKMYCKVRLNVGNNYRVNYSFSTKFSSRLVRTTCNACWKGKLFL